MAFRIELMWVSLTYTTQTYSTNPTLSADCQIMPTCGLVLRELLRANDWNGVMGWAGLGLEGCTGGHRLSYEHDNYCILFVLTTVCECMCLRQLLDL